MMTMNMEHCWPEIMGAMTPLEFMYRHKTQSPEVAVRDFMNGYPRLYGIVLQGTWKNTFQSDVQYNRDEIAWALMVHLEDHRAEWDKQLARIFEEEAQASSPTAAVDGAGEDTTAQHLGEMGDSQGSPGGDVSQEVSVDAVDALDEDGEEKSPASPT